MRARASSWAYVGLAPSERIHLRHGSARRDHKAGNSRERALLVESAWTYRHPPRVGAKKLYRLEKTTPRVRELAWKAQVRLTARYRALSARGKKSTVVCAAIARELTGFMGAVQRSSSHDGVKCVAPLSDDPLVSLPAVAV